MILMRVLVRYYVIICPFGLLQVNVRKSSVVWFRIRQYKFRVLPPLVYLDGSLLSCVEYHKYLGFICAASCIQCYICIATTLIETVLCLIHHYNLEPYACNVVSLFVM